MTKTVRKVSKHVKKVSKKCQNMSKHVKKVLKPVKTSQKKDVLFSMTVLPSKLRNSYGGC